MNVTLKPHGYPANRTVTLREQKLESELESAHGSLMYAEAADFMSADDRQLASDMRHKISQVTRELVEVRGNDILADSSIDEYHQAVKERNPLARLGVGALAAHLPVFTGSMTDSVHELRSGLIYKSVSQEEFEGRLQERAPQAEVGADDLEARKQAADILRSALPKDGPDLFASVSHVMKSLEKADSPLITGVMELVDSGRVQLQAGDFNQGGWRCLYENGDLGRYAERLDLAGGLSRKGKVADRIGKMLELPDIEITPEERKSGFSALQGYLSEKLENVQSIGLESYRKACLKRFNGELDLWQSRGVDVSQMRHDVENGLLEWNLGSS